MTTKINDIKLWKRSVAFHGHICPGLTIGYKAALYAKELLGLNFSKDEEVVCVSENDACGVDAISVILGCSIGKGNLLFRLRGKQAYSFFNRSTGQCVRLVLKNFKEQTNTQEERQAMIFEMLPKDLFDIKEPSFGLPENAVIFNSIACNSCGENTSENYIRLENSKKLCLDCFRPYSRFM